MGQTLPQMGLATWPLLTDNYNKDQLSGNFNILNFHDHTPGKGVPIPEGGLAPNSIGARELNINVAEVYPAWATASGTTFTSGTYANPTTSDVIGNVTVAANSIVELLYFAQVSLAGFTGSPTASLNAAIFLNSTAFGTQQVGAFTNGAYPVTSANLDLSNLNTNAVLTSTPTGVAFGPPSATSFTNAAAAAVGLSPSTSPTVQTLTLVSGTALQDTTNLPSTVYVSIGPHAAGTVTIAIGSTSGATTVLATTDDATLARTHTIKLPPSWWIKVTVAGSATIGTVTQVTDTQTAQGSWTPIWIPAAGTYNISVQYQVAAAPASGNITLGTRFLQVRSNSIPVG